MIDLRSDTVTRPTPAMLDAMMKADVGDDVLGDDPTVDALETKSASMFGHPAALFCPSGTMCNQIAIQLHCQRLDEAIVDYTSHIYKYETGGYAYVSGVPLQAVRTDKGLLTPEVIEEHIHPRYDWLPRTRLVSIENSCNRAGGIVYKLDEMKALHSFCEERGLAFHLDGARIFNAMAALDIAPDEVGPLFDTISVCLSKGLGAPIGSVLIGSPTMIEQARRLRKVMGGGMRQVGILAAAGIHALDHHIDRLDDDHRRARQVAEALRQHSWVTAMKPQVTNMVLFQIDEKVKVAFHEKMNQHDIALSEMGEGWYRMVTHLDITDEDIEVVLGVVRGIR